MITPRQPEIVPVTRSRPFSRYVIEHRIAEAGSARCTKRSTRACSGTLRSSG